MKTTTDLESTEPSTSNTNDLLEAKRPRLRTAIVGGRFAFSNPNGASNEKIASKKEDAKEEG